MRLARASFPVGSIGLVAWIWGCGESVADPAASPLSSNRPPTAVAPIPDLELLEGHSTTVELAPHFLDPDGDTLTYVAASSDTGVATVQVTHRHVTISGSRAGTATIHVRARDPGGYTATQDFAVTVATPAPARVLVTPQQASLQGLGDTLRLSAEVHDQIGRRMVGADVSWLSEDTGIATIDAKGLVTGVAPGATAIQATAGAVSGQARVSVVRLADSVTVSPATATILPSDTLRLSATATDEHGGRIDEAVFTWTSSDTSVTVIDQTGLVRGVRAGTAELTASTAGAEGTGRVMVVSQDRDALVAFYRATGGDRWENNENWLTDSPVDDWHGVSIDSADRVSHVDLPNNGLEGQLPEELAGLTALEWLDLSSNRLTGPIPPETGNLINLDSLDLSSNELTGSIPQDWGSLPHLKWLDLSSNRLTGSIPRELGGFVELGGLTGLRSLNLANNRLTGSVPDELGNLYLRRLDLSANELTGLLLQWSFPGWSGRLRSLDLSHNEFTGPIPDRLRFLNGLRSLRLEGNRLSGEIPFWIARDYYGPGPRHLEWLSLDSNELTGPIPPNIGTLWSLKHLSLTDNDLSGAIPAKFGRLEDLEHLNVSGNAQMAGPLPAALTNLDRLEVLLASETDLCAPPEIEDWLRGIPTRDVTSCPEPATAVAYLMQAASSGEFRVPLVAGEEAFLRVFVTAQEGEGEFIPPVRARFYVDGSEVHQEDIPQQSSPIPQRVDESDLAASANAVIPSEVVRPGLEMVIDIDPEGTVPPGLGIATRIPESGRVAMDVRVVPTLDLTLIPFQWSENPNAAIVDAVEAMANDPGGHDMLWATRTLLPVQGLEVSAHEPVLVSQRIVTGSLFTIVARILNMEGAGGHYMGIAAPRSNYEPGLARPGGRYSVSTPDADVIGQHLGRNFNMAWAPCGSVGEDAYPNDDGSIGVWGYDLRHGGQLVPPTTPDLMSQCGPARWISDFNFATAFRYRLATEGVTAGAASKAPVRSLVLWGGVDAGGELYLDPAFVIDVPPTRSDSAAEYTITGRTAEGDELFSHGVHMERLDDEGRAAHFMSFRPVQAEWRDKLASVTLSGPGGSVTLDGNAGRSMAIARNPRTGQIRAFLRDLSSGDMAHALEAAALTSAHGLEVLVSRGLPDPDAWRR